MSSTSTAAQQHPYHGYLPFMSHIAYDAIEHHRALHNHGEFTVLLTLLDQARPLRIIETGTWAGGSAWAFSRLTSVKHIITIDPAPQPGALELLASLPVRTTLFQVDSTTAAAQEYTRMALEGAMADVLFIDGGHEYRTARHDFEAYSPMVRPGGLIVLHDTQGHPASDLVQVPQLWAELRTTHQTTELVDIPGGPGGTGIIWT